MMTLYFRAERLGDGWAWMCMISNAKTFVGADMGICT